MTRKLPADIASPEERGAVRPDQPKRQREIISDREVIRRTSEDRNFRAQKIGDDQWLVSP